MSRRYLRRYFLVLSLSGLCFLFCTTVYFTAHIRAYNHTVTLTRAVPFANRYSPYRAYWVDSDAPLLDKLGDYLSAISRLRDLILHKRANARWQPPSPTPRVVFGGEDDFLQQLSDFDEVNTISLTWVNREEYPFGANRNVLIDEYYDWVASEPMCTWIRNIGKNTVRWEVMFNGTCTTDTFTTLKPRPLEPIYFTSKAVYKDYYWPNNGLSYPKEFYLKPTPHVLYIQICQDAVITDEGAVFCGSVKIVPYSCSHDRSATWTMYLPKPVQPEVFVMSGYWGSAHFHINVELVPRVAPYVEFLLNNPSIKVQVSDTGGATARMLNVLGLKTDRLISGITKARVVYLPQGTACGFAQVQETQILSRIYRNYIKRISVQIQESIPRTNFVMIHRSGTRRLIGADIIESDMKDLAEEFGLDFFLFHDKHLPSLEDTMLTFNRAAVVVAPHGAGLSNLLFCEPGTFVIEAVCNAPHMNLCFQRLAHILGHRYHGIPSERGCERYIEINPDMLKGVVRSYLHQWKKLNQHH